MKKRITLFSVLLLVVGLLLNTAATGQEVIYSNQFNDPAGQLPQGWILEGAQAPWSVGTSAMAGGSAPELVLGYSFASGLSRLISPVIDIQGYDQLCLRYKQYLFNYEMDYGEIIGLDITYDGGATWEPLMEKPIGLLNIPQDEFSYFFSPPAMAEQIQFAFRFDGNNYAINFWAIDDIVLESPVQNDLLTGYFSGNTTPGAGIEELYFIEVINGGKLFQQDYTVKLMDGDGNELSSTAGMPVAFGEKMFHLLWWTPPAGFTGSMDLLAQIDFAADENQANNRTRRLPVYVQPANTASSQTGNGSQPLGFLPCNFFNLHSITQSIYLPEEVNAEGFPLTGIQYTCQFDNDVNDVSFQILLGETQLNNLADHWIDPASLTPVFIGEISFTKGFNNIFIPFDNSFTYHGGNLVVQTVKSFSEMVLGTAFISSIDTGASRSRIAERDDMPFNPLAVPEFGYSSDYYPNISVFYSTGTTQSQPAGSLPDVKVYPVPAAQHLFVESPGMVSEARLLDMTGREVYIKKESGKSFSIGVDNLKPGLYLLQLNTSSGLFSGKVQIK